MSFSISRHKTISSWYFPIKKYINKPGCHLKAVQKNQIDHDEVDDYSNKFENKSLISRYKKPSGPRYY